MLLRVSICGHSGSAASAAAAAKIKTAAAAGSSPLTDYD